MTWRRSPLPTNWTTLRAVVLERDPTCRLGLDCCTIRASEVDHIGDADDHRPHMLRGVCHPCHARRTAQQAADAKPRARRKAEQHPGIAG